MEIIKDNALYLLRVDFDSFIVHSYDLKNTLFLIDENRVIKVLDINNNMLLKPFTEETKISYQELYRVKRLELM